MAHRRLTLFALLGTSWVAACNASPEADLASPSAGPGLGATGGSHSGSAGSGSLLTSPPDEQEADDTYTAPVVSGHWIWTANPLSGKVALIDATTLRVATTDAGLAPTYVASLAANAGEDSAAIVLNVGNDTASVLHATSGVIDLETVKVHPGANRMTVSPSGRWAIVWSDAALLTNPDPTEGLQDVTVVDLASAPPVAYPLTVGYRPSRVSIGENEKHAYFVTEPGVSVLDLPKADPPTVSRDVTVAADPTEAASVRDVTVTPDGSFAIVRRENKPTVSVVSLSDAVAVDVTLPGPVTDLDLSPAGDVAFAVVRATAPGSAGTGGTAGTGGVSNAGTGGTTSGGGQAGAEGGAPEAGGQSGAPNGNQGGQAGAEGGAPEAGGAPNAGEGTNGGAGDGGMLATAGMATSSGSGTGGTAGTGGNAGTGGSGGQPSMQPQSFVAALPLATILKHPDSFRQVTVNDTVGSIAIAPNGDVAVLYTNATDSDHLVILNTKTLEVVRTVLVQSPVQTVLPAPDGKNAVALLRQASGSQKAGGFSLVPLTGTLPPKLVGTDAPPQSVALGEEQALITVQGTDPKTRLAVHAVYLAQLAGFGTTEITLASPPLSAALIPDVGKGLVAQSHPEGRITFVDLETAEPRTITGFELSSRVTQDD